jgi:MFS family permease
VQNLGLGLFLPYTGLYLTGELGVSAGVVGVLLAVNAFVGLAAAPVGGVAADRVGRRPVMLVGLAASGAAAIAFGLVSSVAAVGVLIAIWAFAEGLFQPAANAYVADLVDPELRTEAYGLWRIFANAAVAVGPPLGALLVWAWTIRLTFVVAGVASLGYLAIAWRALPESRPRPHGAEQPARLREALHDRVLLALGVGVFLSAVLYAWYDDVWGVFLHEERGFAIATWGLVFGINPLLVTCLQYPIARAAARRSARLMLAFGTLLYGAAFALLWLVHGLGALVAAVVVLTCGEMLISPVATTVAANIAPERLRGTYQAVLEASWGGSAGPAYLVGFWLVGAGHGELMLALGVPLAIVGAASFAALPRGATRPALAEVP